MGTVAKLYKNGTFVLKDDLSERLPVITDGLVVHYPLDGKGGAFDIVGGTGTDQNIESGINLIESMAMDWRDPSSWSSNSGLEWHEGYQALKWTGYHNSWLKTPIVVDPTKEYQVSMEIMEEVSGALGLYLGGVDYNAAGLKVTANYDYTLAANTTPPLGEWITYRITRTGTGAITSQTSTSFTNSCGWTGTAQTDNLTKYYHLGGLFNYNSGGIMYVRNLSIVAIDSDASNTIETEESISVEQTTTNLFTWGNFESFDNWSCSEGTREILEHQGYLGRNATRITKTAAMSTGNFQIRPTSGFPEAVVAGTTYYASIKYKVQEGNTFRIGDWAGPDGNIPGWTILATVDLTNGWKQQIAYHTYTNAGSAGFTFGVNSTDPDKYGIFSDFILQKNTFNSAFHLGTSSQGKIFLPIEHYLNNTSGTIHFKYKSYYNISNTIISGSIIQNSPPNSKWWGLYHDSSGNVYTHWLNGSSNNSGTPLTRNTWNDYTIKWNASNEYFYINGNLGGSKSRSVENPTDQFPTITLGWGWTGGYGEFKDLSIYDRDLSDDEIDKLINQSMGMKETETVSEVIVETSVIPSDAYYYPLSNSSLDITNTKDASDNTNVAYENGAIWIGNSTSNTFGTPDFNTSTATGNWNHWGSTGHIGSYGQNTDRDFILTPGKPYSHWVANGAGATSPYLLYQSPAFDGGYRSSQAMIKMSDGSEVTQSKVYPVHNANNGGLSSGVWSSITHIGGGWYHCKAEGFSQDGTNDLVGFYIAAGYKAYFDWCQLEDKLFASPFVNGTRDDSALEFNFNSSISLDWSGSWSLSYWKMPIATYTDVLTGYNIESFGSNSNTVGGGYYWYGKSNGADTLSSSTPTNISPSSYFNHWHFISHVKSGTNIVTTTRGIDGNLLSIRNQTTTSSVSNYYVCPHGYDFKMGGWDNTNPTNTYFRDLVVVKRAISSTEEEQLYMGMKMYKDKVLFKNLIEQGL